MKRVPILPALIERFFTERLIRQRNVSVHTIASYRDTFRLFLQFTQRHLKREPSDLELSHIDAPLISAFLDDLEATRAVGARTRNLRLTAIAWSLAEDLTAVEEQEGYGLIGRVRRMPAAEYTAGQSVRTLSDIALPKVRDSPLWVAHALMSASHTGASDRIGGPRQQDRPESAHVESINMRGARDEAIWSFARDHGFTLVSKDDDFRSLALVRGAPPKVVWLQIGNAPTSKVR